jgi:hypothetical protein
VTEDDVFGALDHIADMDVSLDQTDTMLAKACAGDTTAAEAIFTNVVAITKDAVKRAADAEYALGLIAHIDARLTDAAAHFARASQLRLAAMSPDERAAHDAANGPKGE